jgi:hypothetical protein
VADIAELGIAQAFENAPVAAILVPGAKGTDGA